MRSETFGEFIRRKRMENGVTLRQVSNATDIDQSTMSKIERNELMAPQRIIKPLSRELGVEYRELQIK